MPIVDDHFLSFNGTSTNPSKSLFFRKIYAIDVERRSSIVHGHSRTLPAAEIYYARPEICTGVVDEIDHKIISDFNPPSTIDRNSL